MKNDDQIRDWLEGNLSSEELERAKREDKDLQSLEEIINKSAQLSVPQGKSKEAAWNDFVSKVEKKPQAKVRRLNPIFPIAIAAALALAIVAYIFVFSATTIETAPGERLVHNLPDGSNVTLNASSQLSYTAFNWENNREVKLTGEAFFDVEKGQSFTVEGDLATITVLGTQFNAYFRETAEVKCYEGSVKVTSNKNQVILEKGEKTTDATEKHPFTQENSTASWLVGEFNYQNEPLELVIDELERQYAITIQHPDLSGRVYTGYFNDKDLDEALQLVLVPMGLSYEKNEGKIIIK